MSGQDGFIALLADIVGAANVYSDDADLASYAGDGRGQLGRACAVVRPASVDEVSAIVRAAGQARVRLVPQGARTGLVAAGVGDETGALCIISLERLKRAPVVDPVNRTVEADAGVLLSDLNLAAGDHGLFFPIDLGANPSVGGMIAANTGGARFLRHGDVRRNLLAVEVVLNDAEGTTLTLGKDLWKDNSGLDLKQLFVGASGSLGIVTRATLALQSRPAASVCALISLPEPRDALRLLVALERGFGTLLTAFEGMSGNALDAALTHVPGLRNPFPRGAPGYAVLIEVAGGSAVPAEYLMERLSEVLADELEAGRIDDAVIDQGRDLWAVRHAIPEGLRHAGRVIACDIALRRGDVMEFRADVGERLAAALPGVIVHDFGHIGDGGFHYNLVWPASAGAYEPTLPDQAREIVFSAAVEDYGGSFSAEHGIGPSNLAYYRRFTPLPNQRLAGAIQRVTAPVPIGRVNFSNHENRELQQ